MANSRVTELLKCLAYRGSVLQSIREGIFDSHKMADEIGKSRSAVDRDIRILKDNGYIHEHRGEYELTRFGEYALELYELADPLGRTEQIVPHLPSGSPIKLLKDASIRQSGGTVPQRPIDHVEDLIRAADKIKVIAPVMFPSITDSLVEGVQNRKLTANVLVSNDVLDELWSTYPEEVQTCLRSGTCTLQQTDVKLSFGLVIADNEIMCLGVCDNSLRLLGTVTNSSEDAVVWGIKTFQEYRDTSDEVFLRGTTRQVALLD